MKYPNLKVYGPNNNLDSIKSRLIDGELLSIIGIDFEVIEIPGHTHDHIAYYANIDNSQYYFAEIHCLQEAVEEFSVFDQMYESLMKLKNYLKIPESIVDMNILLII